MTDQESSKYWRKRAAEARELAAEILDPRSKKTLLDLAEDYDQRAEEAERSEKQGG